MKLVAQASVLANAVTLAATAMRRKPLARVVTADDAVSVTCSDNHIAISANAAATVLEPGAVALSADRLAAVTSGFPASAMVTMSTAEGAAAVVCGNSRSRLAIVPWTDLPSVLAIEFADQGRELRERYGNLGAAVGFGSNAIAAVSGLTR